MGLCFTGEGVQGSGSLGKPSAEDVVTASV